MPTALSDMINKRANLDLARQGLEDATVKAPIGGTIVSRPVTQGQIITAATAANGGTTLMSIADLGRVRMRVTIDEVEMGNVRVESAGDRRGRRVLGPNLRRHSREDRTTGRRDAGRNVLPGRSEHQQQGRSAHAGDERRSDGEGGGPQERSAGPDRRDSRDERTCARRAYVRPCRWTRSRSQLRRDLVSTEGKTGIPGRYVVVELPDKTYEMRLIKTGPTDLKVAQVIDGLKEGDKVVTLGAVLAAKPAIPPKLVIADNMKRGAAVSRATQAGEAAPPAKQPKPAVKPAQLGKATKP